MTAHDDELEQVLRPWMHRHAPDAPSDLVLRIYKEIEAMPDHAASRGRLSRFAAWPATAWAATAAVAIVAVTAGVLLVGFSRLPSIGELPVRTPATSASPSDPSAIADTLTAAWNAGDGQQAVSRYRIPQTPASPVVRFIVDSGIATQTDDTASSIIDGVTAWHAKGTVLTRTGDVLTQGPFAAFPVTWTSPDGSFNGVEVIRISADGLVTEQYLIGASSARSPGTADGTDVVTGIHDGMTPIAARLGAESAASFAPNAEVREFQDGIDGGVTVGRTSIDDVLSHARSSTTASVGTVVTQGPFAVYAASNQTVTGAVDEGFTVLELNPDGLIRYTWTIRTESSGSPSPGPSGG